MSSYRGSFVLGTMWICGIDHILYNSDSGMNATDGGVIELDEPLSDHAPIWAELTLPPIAE